MMRVAIVIPAYNCAPTIEQAVVACLNQSYPKELLEIVAVDDGSTDSTADIVRKLPVKLISQNNSGPASARNSGWKSSQADIICFTDSDCLPEKEWVVKLVAAFSKDDIAAVAGSYSIVNNSSLLAACIYEEIKARHQRMPQFIRAFGSYNAAIRREVLEKTGGFDENYRFPSAEDNDLAYKILKIKKRIYFAKDALAAHYFPESLDVYLRQQFRHGIWRVKLYRNHPDMGTGDDYTGLKDIIEPLLALILIFALPAVSFAPIGRIYLFLASGYALMQLPLALSISFAKKDLKYLHLFWITFLRGFVRGIGLLAGILKDKYSAFLLFLGVWIICNLRFFSWEVSTFPKYARLFSLNLEQKYMLVDRDIYPYIKSFQRVIPANADIIIINKSPDLVKQTPAWVKSEYFNKKLSYYLYPRRLLYQDSGPFKPDAYKITYRIVYPDIHIKLYNPGQALDDSL